MFIHLSRRMLTRCPVREISAGIAKEVIRAAQAAGVDRHEELRAMNDDELLKFVEDKMWNP